MAEAALISSEESIMSTFDFLASETADDEENLSDGDGEDGGGADEDSDDKFLVKRSKVKVSHLLSHGGYCQVSKTDSLCRLFL